jgi:hypothetical protein
VVKHRLWRGVWYRAGGKHMSQASLTVSLHLGRAALAGSAS